LSDTTVRDDGGDVPVVLTGDGESVKAGPDPIRRFPTPVQLAWVERALGSGAVVTGGRRMVGGITSSVHRLSVRTSSGTTQVVLKRYCEPLLSARDLDDTGAEPGSAILAETWAAAEAIVINESTALAAVESTTVPAPHLLGVSVDGADSDGAPSLLMTRAPGRVELAPDDLNSWIRQLAALLPVLHAGSADVWTGERRDPGAIVVPQSAKRPEVWIAARNLIAENPPSAELVFTHGDYQHFNVLWTRHRLSALVDWSSSRVGPADLDVGHCRLNLAVLYSAEVAEDFLMAYESESGRRVDPWWDVHQLLSYDDSWPRFIPVQVAGRVPVDVREMTGRVEELLTLALSRL
jgi:aminoglycoside phosphotransferase